MFPDFPKAKKAIHKHLMDFFHQRIHFHSGSLVKEIPKRVIQEGSGQVMKYADGTIHESALSSIRAESGPVHPEKIIENPDEVYRIFDEMAKEVAIQQSKLIIEGISDVTEKIGNTIKTKGAITPESILEMFEKITIDFNPDGTPKMPTIYAGDLMMKELPKVFQSISSDPLLEKRFQDIMDNQKLRWYDRAANRKLVD
jgi:hypothetical protein